MLIFNDSMTILREILRFIVSILILITLASILARRKKQYTPTLLSEFKLKLRTTPHAIILPTTLRYEHGYIHLRKILSAHVTGEEVRAEWKGSKTVREDNFIDVRELCMDPPLLAKSETMYQALLPGVMVRNGKYKGAVIACFNTSRLNAKGFIHDLYEYGFTKGYVEISSGIIKVLLEHQDFGAGNGKKSRVKLDLCSMRNIRSCMRILELTGSGVRELKYTYPVTRLVVIGYSNGEGFDELFKIIDKAPSVIGPGLVLRLTTKRGFTKRVTMSALEYFG
ncbi:MAG: hypothetical protein QXX93_03355 [Desulfurococcaceae archaeon]